MSSRCSSMSLLFYYTTTWWTMIRLSNIRSYEGTQHRWCSTLHMDVESHLFLIPYVLNTIKSKNVSTISSFKSTFLTFPVDIERYVVFYAVTCQYWATRNSLLLQYKVSLSSPLIKRLELINFCQSARSILYRKRKNSLDVSHVTWS